MVYEISIFFFFSNRTRSGDFYRQYEYALREILSLSRSFSLLSPSAARSGSQSVRFASVITDDRALPGKVASPRYPLCPAQTLIIDIRESFVVIVNIYIPLYHHGYTLFDICPFIILISEIYYRDFVAANVLLDVHVFNRIGDEY